MRNSRGRPVTASSVSAQCTLRRRGNTSASNRSTTNRRISRPSFAGFARKTGNRGMNGMRGIEFYTGLICWLDLSRPYRAGGNWLVTFTWGFARRFTPGCHMMGFQPSNQRRIVVELDTLQFRECALKRLQAETAGRQSLHAPLDALLPALLDRVFKSQL